eukprot:gnl/Chilomastix_cuspidata/995.p1 GENE.gnl/Chilomastix_cuspidata/995~~gnl/Chilomastix_cuspidata/995.p1  ORF type:complete len:284 (+),score=36.83 gnl/Chilomastix_cuspidata/995:89-940(+)
MDPPPSLQGADPATECDDTPDSRADTRTPPATEEEKDFEAPTVLPNPEDYPSSPEMVEDIPSADAERASTEDVEESNPEQGFMVCPICMSAAVEPVVTRCGHLLCYNCLSTWWTNNNRNKQCPVCRASLNPRTDVIPIFSGAQGTGPSDAASEFHSRYSRDFQRARQRAPRARRPHPPFAPFPFAGGPGMRVNTFGSPFGAFTVSTGGFGLPPNALGPMFPQGFRPQHAPQELDENGEQAFPEETPEERRQRERQAKVVFIVFAIIIILSLFSNTRTTFFYTM